MNGLRFGPFLLDRPIGEGGMGIVYLAHHVTLGTLAVVKLLKPEFTRHPEILQRFVNEARAAAHLNHRNIVQVYDCGQAGDGQWYIALKFLDGAALSRFIASFEGRPIDPVTVVHVLCQACNALQIAHEHGIVHRDVKPDNIFLTQQDANDRHVTLLDFGIAKLGEGDWNVSTRSGVVMGTLAYMAPEQLLNSKAVDPRSDVYALGVIAYEMLTGGQLPFGTDFASQVELYGRQTRGALPDPRRVFPGITDAMAYVVGKALQPDAAHRWQTARELALALAEAAPAPAPGMPGGVDLLETYARELRQVATDAMVGNRVPASASSPSGLASRGSGAAVSAPLGHTLSTLSGAASNVLSPGPRSGGRWLAGLAVAAAAAIGITIVVVATRQSDDGSGPALAGVDAMVLAEQRSDGAVAAVAVAVTIATDPPGATVFVDDSDRGPSPVTVSAAAGADLRIRTELASFLPAERTIRVGAAAETVSLALQAITVDASTRDAPPASRPVTRKPPRPGRDASSGPVNLDDVGGD